jgi:hypothetical protein
VAKGSCDFEEAASDRSDEEGSWFMKCLGAWGTHADSEKRAKAERLASLPPGDGRRRPAVRTEQFGVRISAAHLERAKVLIAKFGARDGHKWSQADFMEHAIDELAKAHGL